MDARETAPILGALKLTGKTAGGWSVGLMTSVTGKVDAEIRTPTATSVQAIEPLTTYSAGRVSRDFRDGASGLGVLATATNRRLDDLSRERLHSGAYSAAFDWWHRFGSNQDIEFDGWLIGTHVRGSESALARTQRTAQHLFTRPDADHVTYDPTRTSLNGWAGEAGLGKTGGNWTWNLGTGTRSPGVEVNDLGFLSYGDLWYLSTSLKYSEFEAGRLLRNWYLEGRFVPAWTYGGERIRESFHVNARATLLNFWQAETQIERWGWHLWPWELRGGPALRIPGFTDVRWILRSDSRKSWSVRLQGNVRRDDQGGSREYVFDPKIDFRPTARATVSLGPVLRIDRDADQYVARASASGGDEYVVGRLEQTTAILEARVSYGFSPTLTLDLFAQPFVSNGSYDRFRTVANPTEADFEARLPLIQGLVSDPVQGTYTTPEFSFSDPDFNVREFRMNAVLRWEYRPGSTLFLVWTQAREDGLVVGDFDLGRDVDRLFASPATNVVMVKMNYWLGF